MPDIVWGDLQQSFSLGQNYPFCVRSLSPKVHIEGRAQIAAYYYAVGRFAAFALYSLPPA